ncbi:MAG: DNA-directed RNA polymerase subunit omega [Bacilli bacterium]|nr:DNA-directed RNA polymerase subunit omega [Bacilli bacterium]
MVYPSIDKVLNIIPSKYQLVYVVAKRSHQMKETKHYQLPDKEYKSSKNIGKALEEVAENLIHIAE